MASVILDLVPQKGYTKLHIYEAPSKAAAPGSQIEVVTIDPDNPLTRYTTSVATSVSDWFSIQWEDDKGGLSPMSEPVQGGTSSIVSQIVDRVLLRDSTIDELIATQAAEFVIESIMGTTNPYDPALTPTFRQLEGMTLLALAHSKLSSVVSGSSASYTAGLVSQKNDSSSGGNLSTLLDYLLKEANKILGLNFTVVMLLEDIDPTGIGSTSSINFDASRLALTINLE